MSMLAQMSWTQWFLGVLLICVCCFLMLVILLQRGRGGGLVGAFGGAGGSSAFGAKTGDVFTWITVVVATLFVVLAVVGNFAFDESATPTRTPTVQTGAPAAPVQTTPTSPTQTPSPISTGAIGGPDLPQPIFEDPGEADQPPAETGETTSDTDTAGDLLTTETGDALDATGTTADPDEGAEEEPAP